MCVIIILACAVRISPDCKVATFNRDFRLCEKVADDPYGDCKPELPLYYSSCIACDEWAVQVWPEPLALPSKPPPFEGDLEYREVVRMSALRAYWQHRECAAREQLHIRDNEFGVDYAHRASFGRGIKPLDDSLLWRKL